MHNFNNRWNIFVIYASNLKGRSLAVAKDISL